jgi:hypothetical protein
MNVDFDPSKLFRFTLESDQTAGTKRGRRRANRVTSHRIRRQTSVKSVTDLPIVA